FLCLALFFFYGGSLLALDSQIYYHQPPVALNQFAIGTISIGLCLLPALLFHLHMEYAETRGPRKNKRWKLAVLILFYADGLHLGPFPMQARTTEALATAFSLLPILPFSVLIYLVFRHNFLQIGRQKNLLYAISATFLALLYLSLVRRVGTWLEPLLPPEASASVLLFVLVIFIEPLQRALGRRLQETAHREMDRVQRLTAEIQQEARQGN